MPLTADRNTPMKDGELISVPVAANVVIYAGALVAASSTGLATPGAVATALTYLGRAEEQVDNTGGAASAKSVLIRMGKAFKFKNYATDPVVQADMGKVCYIFDDEQVAHTDGSAARSAAGKVVGVETDGVWVQ